MMIVIAMIIASYTNDNDRHRDDDCIVHKWWLSSSRWSSHRTQMMMIIIKMIIASYTNDDDDHHDDHSIIHKWWWSSSRWSSHRTQMMMIVITMMTASYMIDDHQHHIDRIVHWGWCCIVYALAICDAIFFGNGLRDEQGDSRSRMWTCSEMSRKTWFSKQRLYQIYRAQHFIIIQELISITMIWKGPPWDCVDSNSVVESGRYHLQDHGLL